MELKKESNWIKLVQLVCISNFLLRIAMGPNQSSWPSSGTPWNLSSPLPGRYQWCQSHACSFAPHCAQTPSKQRSGQSNPLIWLPCKSGWNLPLRIYLANFHHQWQELPQVFLQKGNRKAKFMVYKMGVPLDDLYNMKNHEDSSLLQDSSDPAGPGLPSAPLLGGRGRTTQKTKQ